MLGRAQVRNAPAKSAAARSVAGKKGSTWQGLWRQAGWGLAAAAALDVAVLSGHDEETSQRLARFFSSLLSQALRGLADDRDRLAARQNAFEHEMQDMSAGIKQQIEAAKADAIKTAKQRRAGRRARHPFRVRW